jgi:hypothetical protein
MRRLIPFRKKLMDFFGEIGSQVAPTIKQRIFDEVVQRLGKIINSCSNTGGIVRQADEWISIPPARLSGMERTYSKHFLALDLAFSDSFPRLSFYNCREEVEFIN